MIPGSIGLGVTPLLQVLVTEVAVVDVGAALVDAIVVLLVVETQSQPSSGSMQYALPVTKSASHVVLFSKGLAAVKRLMAIWYAI